MTPIQFNALIDALTAYRAWPGPADAFLKHFFAERKALGQQDRAVVSECLYAGLRRYRHLEAWVPEGHPRHQALTILTRIRGLSLRELESVCTEADREWVVKAKSDKSSVPESLGLQAELPDWVVSRLQALMGSDEILALGRALQEPAPLDLRINTIKAKRPEIEAALREAGVGAEATPYSPWGLRIRGKPALQGMTIYKDGQVEVQDEGSQLLGVLLAPRRKDMVVDFCAGAGGKTLLLGAAMQNEGRIYAFDVSEKRLSNLKPRLKRSGLSNVYPVLIASEGDARVKRLKGKIDRVLVDAPCSGLGTLRRNPDLKLRQSETSVQELIAKQASILAAASELVKPGGLLVYATCSLLVEENEAQAEAFSAAHPEFLPITCGTLLKDAKIPLEMGQYLRLWPHIHGTDGFFAAAWTRQKDDSL